MNQNNNNDNNDNNDKTIWNTLKNEIRTIPTDHPVFIYICVGSASYSKDNMEILPQYYHQFPPFLQNMRNTYPEMRFVLLLIDPFQESPPRVTQDYSLYEVPETNQTYYKNQDGTMRSFILKNTVYTDADENLLHIKNAINITKELTDLNEFARYNDITLLYDTFTGHPVSNVAEYVDIENKGHLQQIVYGISGRDNHGCECDLTQPLAYYPFRLDKNPRYIRPIIKLYNHYKYIVNNDYTNMLYDLTYYPSEMHMWSELHKNKIIENSIDKLKNVYLMVLRNLFFLIKNKNEMADSPLLYIFNKMPLIYRTLFGDLYNEKEYTILYELFSNYVSDKLHHIALLKTIETTGEHMLQMITNSNDPYTWCDNLNNMMKVIMKH